MRKAKLSPVVWTGFLAIWLMTSTPTSTSSPAQSTSLRAAICGHLNALTNSTITIGETNITFPLGAINVSAPPSIGSRVCLNANLMSFDTAPLMVVGTGSLTRSNADNTKLTTCGKVSQFIATTATTPGKISLNGTHSWQIAPGATIFGVGLPSVNRDLCLHATLNAQQIVAPSVVTAQSFEEQVEVCGIPTNFIPVTATTNGKVVFGTEEFPLPAGTVVSGLSSSLISTDICVYKTLAGQPIVASSAVTVPSCNKLCFHTPRFFLNQINSTFPGGGLPTGTVVIAGVNFNNPINIQGNYGLIRNVLYAGCQSLNCEMGSTVALFNQQFVTAQLAVALAGSNVLSLTGVLATPLSCYAIDLRQLSCGREFLTNGFVISPDTTLGQLFEQAMLAVRRDRERDLQTLAGVFHFLNRSCDLRLPPLVLDALKFCTVECSQGTRECFCGGEASCAKRCRLCLD